MAELVERVEASPRRIKEMWEDGSLPDLDDLTAMWDRAAAVVVSLERAAELQAELEG